jgi:protein subunit release factor A
VSRELLFSLTKKDFKVDYFRCGGAGGQHRDKTSNGARVTHIDSGAVGQSTEHREQPKNRAVAFKRMSDTKEFKVWMDKRVAEYSMDLDALNARVDRMMAEEYLKIEGISDEQV